MMNNLITHFTNFLREKARIFDGQKQQPPPILQRFANVPVYKFSGGITCVQSGSQVVNRTAAFYFFNEADCDALFSCYDYGLLERCSGVAPVPLSEPIEMWMSPEQYSFTNIRLIPDISQIKNAVQLIRKREGRNKAGYDESFTGVPIFQSKAVSMRMDGSPDNPPSAFFRKEDLEKALRKEKKRLRNKIPDLDQIIEVTPLEEIIQDMQHCSNSKWNDVVFLPPGGLDAKV